MSLSTILLRMLQSIRSKLKFLQSHSPLLLLYALVPSLRAKLKGIRRRLSSSWQIGADGGIYQVTHKHAVDEATCFTRHTGMGRDGETKAVIICPSTTPVELSHLSHEVDEVSQDPGRVTTSLDPTVDLQIEPGEPLATSSFIYLNSHQQALLPTLSTEVDMDAPGQNAATSSPELIRTEVADVHNADSTPMPAVGLSAAHPVFNPIAPERLLRYERDCSVKKGQTTLLVEPLRESYEADEPAGWSSFLHPEGTRYFYDAERRIYTDANMNDPYMISLATKTIDALDDYIRSNYITLNSDVDIVLDFEDYGGGDYTCHYYLASHKNRSIVWLDPYYAGNLYTCYEVQGVTSFSHLGHEIEAQYWYHCSFFPGCRKITLDEIGELREILTWDLYQLTSGTSTTPYRPPELQQMIELTETLKQSVDTPSRQTTCTFVRHKFYYFHGEPAARLDRTQSVYGGNKGRTPLITILSPLLFSAPDAHLEALHNLLVDGLINNANWIEYMGKLTEQWQGFMLYATVLLNANVAFLAIQSVDENTAHPGRSAAQVTSYVSVVASIGAIILGLLLIRQHGPASPIWKNHAEGAGGKFLAEPTQPELRSEALAILYSLPYGLLMWSMVFFLAAFSIMTFNQSTLSVGLVIGSAWLVVSVLVIWCIIIAWDKRGERNPLEAWIQKIRSDLSHVAGCIFHRRGNEREESRPGTTYSGWRGIFGRGSTRDPQVVTA